MATKKKPKAPKLDVEYVVYSQRGGEKVMLRSWPDACAEATTGSVGSETAFVIDVYAKNETGAMRFGGARAVNRFKELGPDRPIERIEIRADTMGPPTIENPRTRWSSPSGAKSPSTPNNTR